MTVPQHGVHYLEIVTPDVDATAAVLSEGHGWSFDPPAPELGNAVVAEIPGGGLCGIRAPMRPDEAPVVRSYLRVADLDGAVAKAAESGAEIALPSMELPGHGRIAIYILGGIQHGLWQLP